MKSISSRQILVQLVRQFMRPIARFCLKNSLKIQDVLDEVKGALVDAAREEMARTGVHPSDSKLAVMTGLQRRDVSRLDRGEQRSEDRVPLFVKVIGEWRTGGQFRTKSGAPRALTAEGKNSEFANLVSSVSGDLNPYTVLFELERLGIVEKKAGSVRLLRAAFVPDRDIRQLYTLLADDSLALFEAVDENISQSDETKNLHITTEYDNLPLSEISTLKEWILKEGTNFHDRVQQFLAERDLDNPSKVKEGKSLSSLSEGGGYVRLTSFAITRAKRLHSK